MNIQAAQSSSTQRDTLEKYLPLLLIAAFAWLFARGVRNMLWTAFGLYWSFHSVPLWRYFW